LIQTNSHPHHSASWGESKPLLDHSLLLRGEEEHCVRQTKDRIHHPDSEGRFVMSSGLQDSW
jgi:hypothetical protein